MYYIIGLGNPGIKYINTRHNAGFLFLNYLNEKILKKQKKDNYSYQYIEGKIFNKPVRLIQPQTYMNRSGKIIYELEQDFNDFEDFVVIHDDIDLPLGKVRICDKGSSGGHNGIKSIINAYKSQKFDRIRIGVNNKKDTIENASKYVLERFSDNELEILYEVFKYTEKGLKYILQDKIHKAMSICNGIEIDDESLK